MLNVLNQFRRMYNDDGRHDRSFDVDETRLKRSLAKLKLRTEELITAAQTLHDLLLDKKPPGALH